MSTARTMDSSNICGAFWTLQRLELAKLPDYVVQVVTPPTINLFVFPTSSEASQSFTSDRYWYTYTYRDVAISSIGIGMPLELQSMTGK